MSFGANALVPSWRPPVLPGQRPGWQHAVAQPSALPPRQPNYAAVNEMHRLQELKRQDEMRRMRAGSGWRQPAPVVNNYYSQPAPIAPVQPAVVTAPAQTPVYMPPSSPSPQPDVSPGNATQDMAPAQDAAAAAIAPPVEEHPGHGIARKLVIGLAIVGVGVGGFVLYKKHKAKGGHGHGMQGFRRRRRGR